MRILSGGFIDRWWGRIINIHPSLLPSYRGLDTHERALKDGVRIHGCTVHFMTGDLDAGPIIAQAAVPAFADDTPDSLAQRVLAQEHRLYPLALDWLAAGRVKLEGGRVAYELEPERDYGPFLVPWAKRR
jgi:phosphoribosylglycinamide formyltransferase-1